MTTTDADIVRMIYELCSVLYDNLPPDGQRRVDAIALHIKNTYDEQTVWAPRGPRE